jgi:hypothetical protein
MTFPQILRQVPDSGSGGSISEIASPSGGDAAPAETPSPAGGSEPTVQEVLRFDMFGPPEKSQPAEAQPAPVPGQPAPAAAVPPTGAPPATPPQGELERLLATQTAQINEVLRRQQEPATPPAAAAPAAPAAPRFQVGVPPQLVQMLRSEDQEEVGRGVHALVNGVSNMVWDAVQEHIQKEVMGQIPQIIQQHYTSQREVQSIESDFYGRYQHVANDAFKPIIQQIGLQLINDLAARGLPTHYTPQVGDIIIQRLHALIPQLGPVPTPGARQTAPAPTAPKPKLNGAGGTRPAPTNSVVDDILGTIRA